MHGFQNNFAVVALVEDKCHLKQFFGVGCRSRSQGQINVIMVTYLACPGHNFNIYAWIAKIMLTVVVLDEEKCYLKHFFT